MNGKGNIRFSSLFEDTVLAHGPAWARNHYIKAGMATWELDFWMLAVFDWHNFVASTAHRQ